MSNETLNEATDTENSRALSGPVQRCVMGLVEKWDWLVYRLAYGSMRRMCKREPAFALILELWIHEWRKQNPIPEHLQESANRFFEAYRDHPSDGTF